MKAQKERHDSKREDNNTTTIIVDSGIGLSTISDMKSLLAINGRELGN